MDLLYEAKRLQAKAQTLASPKIDKVDLAMLCLGEGWTPEQATVAVAVAGAESAYRIRAKNIAKNGTEDYGVFQINSIHQPDMHRIYDPEYNVFMAHRVWYQRASGYGRGGPVNDGFTAWVAYKAGKHHAFMEQAQAAVLIARSKMGI